MVGCGKKFKGRKASINGCKTPFKVYYKDGRERLLICGNSYKHICPYNEPCLCSKCLREDNN